MHNQSSLAELAMHGHIDGKRFFHHKRAAAGKRLFDRRVRCDPCFPRAALFT